MCVNVQPFQAHLATTTDPDKKQMLERLDAAVTAALKPLQAVMEGKAAHEVAQPLAQVRLQSLTVEPHVNSNSPSLCDSSFHFCDID